MARKKPRLVLTDFDVFPLPHRPPRPPGITDKGYAWADPVELLRWVGRAGEAALALSVGFREILEQAHRLPFRLDDVLPGHELLEAQAAAADLFHILNDHTPDEWNAAVCDHEEAGGRHYALPDPVTPAMLRPIPKSRRPRGPEPTRPPLPSAGSKYLGLRPNERGEFCQTWEVPEADAEEKPKRRDRARQPRRAVDAR